MRTPAWCKIEAPFVVWVRTPILPDPVRIGVLTHIAAPSTNSFLDPALDGEPVAAGALGLVELVIGPPDQVGGGLRVVGALDSEAEADAQVVGVVLELE